MGSKPEPLPTHRRRGRPRIGPRRAGLAEATARCGGERWRSTSCRAEQERVSI